MMMKRPEILSPAGNFEKMRVFVWFSTKTCEKFCAERWNLWDFLSNVGQNENERMICDEVLYRAD